MQTFLVDSNPHRSAELLDPKRRFSQIYEGIHILASLTGCNHLLITPKRSVANHPIAQLWAGYERGLLSYIQAHYDVWDGNKTMTINGANILLLRAHVSGYDCMPPELVRRIPYYRTLLLQKDPAFYSKYRWTI